jgi:hypothetical protein
MVVFQKAAAGNRFESRRLVTERRADGTGDGQAEAGNQVSLAAAEVQPITTGLIGISLDVQRPLRNQARRQDEFVAVVARLQVGSARAASWAWA